MQEFTILWVAHEVNDNNDTALATNKLQGCMQNEQVKSSGS